MTNINKLEKKGYKIYELHGTYHGNTDHLSDIGNVSKENRQNMWGFVPKSVGDGIGHVNENIISFILKRKTYPEKKIKSLPKLINIFNYCLNNIDFVLNNIENKKTFFENLIKLQNYLILKKCYNGEKIYIKNNSEIHEEFAGGGGAKFTTDTGVSAYDDSTYSNLDTSPSIKNDLDANSNLYNENKSKLVKIKDKCKLGGLNGTSKACNQGDINNLELKSIKEIIDNEIKIIKERKKSWMSGSQSVKVKDKCRLGGLNGTSKACNQGDIDNLEIKPIDENQYDEGVGDKYLKKKYNIPDEFSDFEKKYKKMKGHEEKEEIVTEIKNIPIIKNPKSLNNLDADVRGVVDKEGNLFTEQISDELVHQYMIEDLSKLGYFEYQDNWGTRIPENYVTIQRYNNTNKFYLGESNVMMYLHNYLREDAKPVMEEFLKKAKIRNPKFDFIPEIKRIEDELYAKNKMKNSHTIKDNVNESISTLNDLQFKDEIKKNGGKIYSVGGAVRDEFLGKESKDLDILITGIPISDLVTILNNYGRVSEVGESYGVIKFKSTDSNEEIDITIPRTETPTGGGGHKDFDVTSDHTLPIEDDLKRRDFTINAIAKDIDGNFIDPYGGQEDLKNKIIRIVNPNAFSDDPLRMLRGIQFSSRFGFDIEPKTMELIKNNSDKISKISPERILDELKKIIDKGGDKQLGAKLLKESRLYNEIFGYDISESELNNLSFEKVKTIGEYIFLLTKPLSNSAEFYKKNLKGDNETYKELKAYELTENTNISNKIIARSIVHNMYLISTKSLESDILPTTIKNAAQELIQGKYPKSVRELAITGNDLIDSGFKGEEIGKIQKNILSKIYADKIRNNKNEILDLLTQNKMSENYKSTTKTEIGISYSAVILDEKSKNRLIKNFKNIIPSGWEILADHMTINIGSIDDDFKRYLGWKVKLQVNEVGIIDDMVIAVSVSGFESKKDKPHITLAVNNAKGAKPRMSDEITKWYPIKKPISSIFGRVTEVPFTIN